ncbi:hypothetical protein PCA20602_00507 [Pandoraea capi]|uniref:Uncharacterized protein n=1 Tax=Pandoraea capi TaxID=2508286 RepID=A0ABY6VNQ8_9BURK|nr:hypothetical protein PCA20602_00507 [Pandoraea capi]
MPTVEFRDFPEEEKQEFRRVYSALGVDFVAYSVVGVIPIGTSWKHRIIFVRQVGAPDDGAVLELRGRDWVGDFRAQIGKLL